MNAALVQKEALRQQMLLRALWGDARPGVVTGWLRDAAPRATRGLQAYGANAGALAERALKAAFPTVAQLVGDESFAGLARAFWRAEPPLQGDIAQWGAALARVHRRRTATRRGAVPRRRGPARLGGALRRTVAATRLAPPTGLECLAETEPTRLRLRLLPGAALVSSAHPVATIWHAHRSDAPDRFDPVREAFARGGGEHVLVWRDGYKAQVTALPEAAGRFTQAVVDGLSLDRALDVAGADFAFEPWLLAALQQGWLAAVRRSNPTPNQGTSHELPSRPCTASRPHAPLPRWNLCNRSRCWPRGSTLRRLFFLSGLTKIRDWDTTLALFADEYHVPLLPTELAAVLGTGGELVLPVLLALGLFGRFAALGLFVVNAVAVLSLTDIAPAALQQHQFWGSLLVGLLLWGPGRWSLDALFVSRLASTRLARTRLEWHADARPPLPPCCRSARAAGWRRERPGRLGTNRKGRARPDGVLQRLGRQRAHQRLPAMGGGRGRTPHGVKLEHVKLADTAEVGEARPRREGGRPQAEGSADMVWINGENFLAMKREGLLFGPFAESAAELRLRRHRGQADHAHRLLGAGRRHGGALGHGAADLLRRRHARAAAAAEHWPSCSRGRRRTRAASPTRSRRSSTAPRS